MLGHTHVVIAGALWAAVWWRPLAVGDALVSAPQAALSPHVPLAVTSLALVGLGALLPDLDHPKALLAQFRPAGTGGAWRYFRPLLVPSVALRGVLGHRGALHSLAATVVLCLVGESLARAAGFPGVGLALGWGYAAHVLADMATRRGVPLLWPLTHVRIGVPDALAIKTGGFGEALYLAGVSALAAFHAAGAL
jgi:membrane-bound metal-dependent hydrolase YbcI (DUF457 family)